MSHCEFCDCHHCEEARWKERRKKELDELIESWNWNCTPAEVARDIKAQDEDWPEIKQAMAARGFSKEELYAVEDAYEVFC